MAGVLLALAACGGPTDPSVAAPAAPTNVTATPGAGYMTIAWDHDGVGVTGFEVQRTEADGAAVASQALTTIAIVESGDRTHRDGTLDIGVDYEYAVVAVGASGSSAATVQSGGPVDVPSGVALSVGTYVNPLFAEPQTAIGIFPYLAASDLPDEPVEVTFTGPAGWNGGAEYTDTAPVAAFEDGFTWFSPADVPAVSGDYEVTFTLDGASYTAQATADAGDVLPAATDITTADATTAGMAVSWSSVPGASSYLPALFASPYVTGADAVLGSFTSETSAIMEGLSLVPGEYFMTVYAYNVDRAAPGRPVAPDQLNVSLGASAPFPVSQHVSPTCAGAQEVVEIPDPLLRQAVRDALDIPSGNITCGDMGALTELVSEWPADEFALTDLDGLQHAENLQHLVLNGNRAIPSIAPLAGLDALTVLGLHGADIDGSETWVLESLLALEELELSGTGFEDFSFLADLPSLLHLHLCCVDLAHHGIDGLTDLTYLEFLGLSHNGLSGDQVAFLSSYENLGGLLIGGNEASALDILADLPDLHTLGLDYMGIDSLDAVPNLATLGWLDLNSNALSDIDALPADLGYVNLEWNYLDLTPGSDAMTKIAALEAGGTHVVYEQQRPHAHCVPALAGVDDEFVALDPQGSFLMSDPDETAPATSISLAGLGLDAGDCLGIESAGGLFFWNGDDAEYGRWTVAVFTGPDGAVGVEGQESGEMPWCGDEIIDLPETFRLPNAGPLYLTVPEGADELLFGPDDCFPQDNHDPQGDYGVLLRY